MKRRKMKKLSLGRVTLSDLSAASGGRRHFSDIAQCSNSCSYDAQLGKICTATSQGQERCGDTETNYW